MITRQELLDWSGIPLSALDLVLTPIIRAATDELRGLLTAAQYARFAATAPNPALTAAESEALSLHIRPFLLSTVTAAYVRRGGFHFTPSGVVKVSNGHNGGALSVEETAFAAQAYEKEATRYRKSMLALFHAQGWALSEKAGSGRAGGYGSRAV